MQQRPRDSRDRLTVLSQRVIWPLGAVILVIIFFRLMPLPLKHVFIIIFATILLAASVSRPARWLSRHHVPRGVAILVIYLLAFAAVAGAVTLLVPLVTSEISQFRSQLPHYLNSVQQLIARFAPDEAKSISSSTIISQFSSKLGSLITSLTSIARTVISVGIDAFIILVGAFFIANDRSFGELAVSRFVPPRHRQRAMHILNRMGQELGGWVEGQLLLAVYFGFVFGVGLYVIGINYAITLGVVGAILEIIPYVGGFLTMILAVLVGLSHDPLHAALTLAWYAVVAETEAHIVHPKLMQHFVRLHPAIIVLALFLGAEAFGIVGALLAIPIAIVIQVLLDEFYTFDGDEAPITATETPVREAAPANGQKGVWKLRWRKPPRSAP